MKRLDCLMTFVALLFPFSRARAQEIGDRQHGLALAQQVCSECHAIRRGQARSPNTRSPTFSETCNHSWNDGGALTVALTTPARGDANVHAYRRSKTRRNRLHPQPAVAPIICVT
jgi:mono/diheme cytochrome c family protein